MTADIKPYGNEARLTDIQGLVVELINRLLSASIDEVDAAIDDGLSKLGAFTGRDRSYVFVIEGEYARNSHEWCADGIDRMKEHLQALPIRELEDIRVPMTAGQVIHAPDIAHFEPGSAEYELLASQGIRSVLIVPMLDEGRFFGLVGFDSVSMPGAFLPGEIYLLRSFADVVMSVLLRRQATLDMRRAQDELASERAFLQGIVSTSATGFVVMSEEGRIIYANDAAETVLGASREFMMGEMYNSPKWQMTDLNGERVKEEDEPFALVQRTGGMVQNHRVALHCDDGVRYASFNAAPIATSDGQAARVVYAVSDVTALVTAEQAREAALDEARRANIAKSNFLAKMSHEIRTPLNGVLGIADILAETVEDKTSLQMINVLRNSGTLLMGIINDLLDMSKIEADALELEAVPFQLSDLARRIEEVHTLRAAEKGLSFSVRSHDPVGALRLGDPQRLTQILHNLISNAVKFTQQGYVNVWLSALDDKMIRLCVEDSGIGMTSKQLQRVFDPFSQADSSISRRFGGTGLGMSIVKRLVEMMEGTITLDSSEKQGTKITINLPLPVATAEQADVKYRPPPSRGASSEKSVLPPLSILVADDNRTNQMILGIMLGQLGAEAVMADDGLAALEKFKQGRFDVLVLDISMPGMDGVTLLNAIRTEESLRGLPHTPALAFTANAMSHQIAGYRAAGFDDCLTKPLRREDLLAALTRVVSMA
ncbi:hybrid sensor histidine kinase/response regulator [Roseinatronobacter alkalisoli]|uniref:histidine kinase n=1 Tax=Roseinatronobacter alkalisoli TaxID=3028235 RepID=A0ABT5T8Y1_9RHOB|nr:ATP-binding protein [Roseinatronobacter sp. HJB301]MDD7971577.1 ATP-binding protein [Roseinatronobacter sp. HJB301]